MDYKNKIETFDLTHASNLDMYNWTTLDIFGQDWIFLDSGYFGQFG